MPQIQLGSIVIDVTHKDIKNVHLSVHPPVGAVTIAAPQRMKLETIRLFAISKLSWIKQRQRQFALQAREAPREFIERETHYVWGKRYLLQVLERDAPPAVELKHRTLVLRVRAGTSIERRGEILENWYREQIRAALPDVLGKWQPLLHVSINRAFVQRMKTKWGSSNPNRRNIRLNTELAKKPRDCLEYVVLHELSHFLSSRHDQRFVSLLDTHLPHWRTIREKLNAAPLQFDEMKAKRQKP
jgi:predicted metal-dependent hydrolase